jgi:hypothetical protein
VSVAAGGWGGGVGVGAGVGVDVGAVGLEDFSPHVTRSATDRTTLAREKRFIPEGVYQMSSAMVAAQRGPRRPVAFGERLLERGGALWRSAQRREFEMTILWAREDETMKKTRRGDEA